MFQPIDIVDYGWWVREYQILPFDRMYIRPCRMLGLELDRGIGDIDETGMHNDQPRCSRAKVGSPYQCDSWHESQLFLFSSPDLWCSSRHDNFWGAFNKFSSMPNMPIQSPPAWSCWGRIWRFTAFGAELENLSSDISFSLLTLVCLNYRMDWPRNSNLG